jgi:hypothetical protein
MDKLSSCEQRKNPVIHPDTEADLDQMKFEYSKTVVAKSTKGQSCREQCFDETQLKMSEGHLDDGARNSQSVEKFSISNPLLGEIAPHNFENVVRSSGMPTELKKPETKESSSSEISFRYEKCYRIFTGVLCISKRELLLA